MLKKQHANFIKLNDKICMLRNLVKLFRLGLQNVKGALFLQLQQKLNL